MSYDLLLEKNDLFERQIDVWLASINVNADKVLDIGGGEFPVIDRVNSWNVNNYVIMDFDAKPEIRLQSHWVEKNIELEKINRKFDVIFCIRVLPYLNDLTSALSHIYQMQNPGGIFYATYIKSLPSLMRYDIMPDKRNETQFRALFSTRYNVVDFQNRAVDDFEGFMVKAVKN